MGKIIYWRAGTLLTALTTITMAAAQQGIRVNIDGSSLTSGHAQEVNGRVLVPLRGVMEQLGAVVDFIPATGIINASKGGMNVQLRLGSRQALINGERVTLDVSPQVIDGSTMVPLRFVGEALGANVDWNGSTQTVSITSATGAAEQISSTLSPESDQVKINDFSGNKDGVIGAGGAVKFTLYGTPGGTATVQIPGATDEVPMIEVAPGTYSGEVRFPYDHPMALRHATAIAKLKVGEGTRIMVLSKPVDIDTQPPSFKSIWPKDTLVPELKPTINAIFSDGVGPGVTPDGITLIVDGRNVSSEAELGSTYMHYTPKLDLAPGPHTCELKVVDGAGNSNDQKWSFTTANAMDLAKSIKANVPANCQPGDQIAITMVGAPSSQATCSIGDRVTNLPMKETSPGVYVASYAVQKGDHFWNDRVSGQIVTQDKQTFTLTASNPVTLQFGPPSAPTFTAPVADTAVGDSVNIQGTGPANSRVHVWIEYQSHITPKLPVTGTLYDAVVDTDSNGNFSTGSVKLDPGLAGAAGIKFTAHVTAIGWDGKTSDASVVTFRRG